MSATITFLYILPIIGGFVYANWCEATRYEIARSSGHRLYFHSALHGLWLAFVTYGLIWAGWAALAYAPHMAIAPPSYFDVAVLIATLLVTPFMGRPIAWVANLFVNKYVAWQRELERDELEMLLVYATLEAQMVMFTLEDEKVYAGFVNEVPDPAHTRHWIGLVPVLSGYRTETRRVEFTLDYIDVLSDFDPQHEPGNPKYTVVVPTNRIVSARLFDPNTYNRFRQYETESDGSTEGPGSETASE